MKLGSKKLTNFEVRNNEYLKVINYLETFED